mmetsp:Transcript_27299/g.90738  ORF Transcript_27299/g.90738 Transcript_27299/m.90738 type:complete len:237 (-) Transcript_27299:739-1449(-)
MPPFMAAQRCSPVFACRCGCSSSACTSWRASPRTSSLSSTAMLEDCSTSDTASRTSGRSSHRTANSPAASRKASDVRAAMRAVMTTSRVSSRPSTHRVSCSASLSTASSLSADTSSERSAARVVGCSARAATKPTDRCCVTSSCSSARSVCSVRAVACICIFSSPSVPDAAWDSSSTTISRARCRLVNAMPPKTMSAPHSAAATARDRSLSVCLKSRSISSRCCCETDALIVSLRT